MVLCAGGIPEFIELENGTCNLANKAIEQIDEENCSRNGYSSSRTWVDLTKIEDNFCSRDYSNRRRSTSIWNDKKMVHM